MIKPLSALCPVVLLLLLSGCEFRSSGFEVSTVPISASCVVNPGQKVTLVINGEIPEGKLRWSVNGPGRIEGTSEPPYEASYTVPITATAINATITAVFETDKTRYSEYKVCTITPDLAEVPSNSTAPSSSVATPSDGNTTESVPSTPVPTVLPVLQSKEIGIAFQVALSGPSEERGKQVKNSIEFAIDRHEHVLALKNKGFTLKAIPLDDQGRADIGAQNAQALREHPQTLCVLGHVRSNVALRALKEYNEQRILVISSGATNPELTVGVENSNQVFWRVVGRDDVQGKVAVKFIQEHLSKVKKVYAVYDRSEYGKKVTGVFVREAAEKGYDVIGSEEYPSSTDQLNELAENVVKSGADLLYFGGYYEQTGFWFKKIRELNPNIIFFGPDGLDSPAIRDPKHAGNAADNMYYTTVTGQVGKLKDETLLRAYSDRFESEVPPFFPESFDAVGMCAKAIAKAIDESDSTKIPTREEVLAQMQKFAEDEVYQGISGNYKFTSQGDPVQSFYYVRQATGNNWSDNSSFEPFKECLPELSEVECRQAYVQK